MALERKKHTVQSIREQEEITKIMDSLRKISSEVVTQLNAMHEEKNKAQRSSLFFVKNGIEEKENSSIGKCQEIGILLENMNKILQNPIVKADPKQFKYYLDLYETSFTEHKELQKLYESPQRKCSVM